MGDYDYNTIARVSMNSVFITFSSASLSNMFCLGNNFLRCYYLHIGFLTLGQFTSFEGSSKSVVIPQSTAKYRRNQLQIHSTLVHSSSSRITSKFYYLSDTVAVSTNKGAD